MLQLLLVDLIVNLILVAENPAEALHVLARPVAHRLAVGAEAVAHQIVRAVDTDDYEAVGVQIDVHVAADGPLAALEHGLHVAHDRIVILSFVQMIAVEGRNLVLPEKLPFRQRMLFEHMVRLDDDHRGGRFEADASLDADDRIAYVHITADAVSRTDFLYFLDGLDRVVEFFIVDRFKLTLLEGQAQLFAAFFGAMFQIGAFGKSLCGVQNLTAANGIPQRPTL